MVRESFLFKFKEPAESLNYLSSKKHIILQHGTVSPKLRWHVGWTQGRRVWSQEGRREGEELDSECVVTTSSRILDHRHGCCTHVQARCVRVRRNQHATTIHPRSVSYPSGVTDGVQVHRNVLNPGISVIIFSREKEGVSSGKKSSLIVARSWTWEKCLFTTCHSTWFCIFSSHENKQLINRRC